MERRVSHLAVAGLVLAILSSVCGPCIAAVHDSPVPAGNTSPCHPGNDNPQPLPESCDCPAWMGAGASSIDAAVASPRTGDLDEQLLRPALVLPVRNVLLAGSIPPGPREDIPRVSLIRRFCIQLE